jgi:Galactosyltransferase
MLLFCILQGPALPSLGFTSMFRSLQARLVGRLRDGLPPGRHQQLHIRRPAPLRAIRRRSTVARLTPFIVAVVVFHNVLMTTIFVSRRPALITVTSDADKRNGENAQVIGRSTAARNGGDVVAPQSTASNADRQLDKADAHVQVAPAAATQPPDERERAFYRKRSTKVNPYRYHVRLSPRDVCRNDTWLIVIVHSHPTYHDRRMAIRQTWGDAIRSGNWPPGGVDSRKSSSCCRRMQLVFTVGMDRNEAVNRVVEDEFQLHDDIVMGDFIDDYRNMTLKSLLDLKFVAERCPRAEYLLKSDDDMIINLPYLADVLVDKRLRRSVMGPLNPSSRVYRAGKWKVTPEEFPFDRYPPYESGSAYVITCDVIGELFDAAEYVPSIFIDDVYITGILGRIIGIQHDKQRGFAFWTDLAPTACQLIERKVLTGTKMTPQALRLIWTLLSAADAAARC